MNRGAQQLVHGEMHINNADLTIFHFPPLSLRDYKILLAGCFALSEEADSVAVERECNVLLSVVVAPMDRSNLYTTHTNEQIVPPKDTLAEKTDVRGQSSGCVCG